MDKKKINEILRLCFGKEKDTKYHAMAMLVIYGIFILLLVIIIRSGNSNIDNTSISNTTQTTTPIITDSDTTNNATTDTDTDIDNDINYSYSYTINYNGSVEVILGKKIDDKEKFTIIKDNISTNYAILNDNYLIEEDGIYHITDDDFSNYFKYCDADEILLLIENEIPTENGDIIKYNITNSSLADSFNDTLVNDNSNTNLITLTVIDNELKKIELDLSNYFTSIENNTVSVNISMEFADIGTTEDFTINVS